MGASRSASSCGRTATAPATGRCWPWPTIPSWSRPCRPRSCGDPPDPDALASEPRHSPRSGEHWGRCHRPRSSPGSPARTAPIWPNSCSTRATRCRPAPPQQHGHLRADHPSHRPDHPGPRRPARRGVDDPGPARPPAERGLQPGGPVLRADLVRPAAADRRGHRARRHPAPRRHPAHRPDASASTRPARARCSARCSRSPRPRRPRSTPAAPTAWPRCTATGSRSTTGRATTCTPARGSCSTTRARGGASSSSPAR